MKAFIPVRAASRPCGESITKTFVAQEKKFIIPDTISVEIENFLIAQSSERDHAKIIIFYFFGFQESKA